MFENLRKSNYITFYEDIRDRGIDYAFEHTVNMGFDAVEVFDAAKPSQWIDRAKMLYLKEKLTENQLAVSCYSMVVNLLSENVNDVMERAFKHIEYAAELGSPYIHHTIVPKLVRGKDDPEYDDVLERVIENVAKIANRCNEYGIVCLYEPQGVYFNGVEGLGTLLKEVRYRNCKVGVCGDVCNSLFVDCPPTEIFKNFSDDIMHVHIKDYLICTEQRKEGLMSVGGKCLVPAPIGKGDVDIKGCLSYLRDYNGAISFETDVSTENMKEVYNRLGI